ncbi:pseudaminic acid synthase [Agarivorans litoreus]|uniref:pseudaminic acid synthase n=1 Tax=Agarivorans litoreus TaxID=1510455 RepID=UPI001C7CDCE5|nr:pseudaminic acid synthase [Agarivorans litoreus]
MYIVINGKRIGPDEPPYVIAEMSGNHNGDINRAISLIKAAKDAGADAVKLQTYTADTITINHDSEEFKITGGLWDGYKLYDLYKEAHTPWAWHRQLFEEAEKIGITIFSSPFDNTAVDFLEELDTPAYKIASFELVDLPLIERVAKTGKPIIMSTGNANLSEIEEAVNTAKKSGCNELVLLHCISGYPTPADESNLATIPVLSEIFDTQIGLSDHTLDIGVSVAAVAMGATIIEKHFTLSRSDGGPDYAFSLEPSELASLVTNCKIARQAIGTVSFQSSESELKTKCHRRSLYIVKNVEKGEVICPEHVRSIRPSNGLAPKYLSTILGRKAKKNLPFGKPLAWSDLD